MKKTRNLCDYNSMETFNYMPFLALGAVLGTMVIVMAYVLARQSERNHQEMTRWLHFMQLESTQTHKLQTQTLTDLKLMIKDAQQTNKANALYLRMVFERIDGSSDGKTSQG